jgi:hypothetical protein
MKKNITPPKNLEAASRESLKRKPDSRPGPNLNIVELAGSVYPSSPNTGERAGVRGQQRRSSLTLTLSLREREP